MNKDKAALAGIGLILALTALATIGYGIFGHSLIQSVYEGTAADFLNRIIEGRQTFPLETYLETGDAAFSALACLALIASLLIWILKGGNIPENRGWWVGGALVMLMAGLAFFLPHFQENEFAYLVFPKKLADPGFLAADWTWQHAQYEHFIFDLFLSPFTRFIHDLPLALFGRLIAWSFLTCAFIRLAKTLELKWWEFISGFAFWFYAGQSLAAGEWIFGGIESKCVSYVFVLLALQSVLKEKWTRAGIFSGLAVSFHVVVGSWAALGLFFTALLPSGARDSKKIVNFCFWIFLFALPGVLPAALKIFKSGAIGHEHYAISALFRGPHHKDPAYFLTLPLVLEMVLCFVATLFFLFRSFPKEAARKLAIFLTTLMVVFVAGIAARKLEWIFFLCLFPFRLGPLFLLFFFAVSSFHYLRITAGVKQEIFLRWVVILLLGFGVVHHRMPQQLFNQTRGAIFEWRRYFEGRQQDNFSEAAAWIDSHIPRDAVFIAPPWEPGFWLLAKRAQVVSFKYLPHNREIQEWMSRLESTNGEKPFKNKGNAAMEELKENYPNLTAAQLESMGQKYSAGYYLTPKERPDLPFTLLYSNDSYYLYNLEKKASGRGFSVSGDYWGDNSRTKMVSESSSRVS